MDAIERQRDMRRVVAEFTRQAVDIRQYEHTCNNTCWVIKTDSSASIELNTPVSSGPVDLKIVTEVLPKLQEHGFWFDHRCGLHIHLDVSDFTRNAIRDLVPWWAKCERFFLNQVPYHRRVSRYCGMITSIDHYSAEDSKYYLPNDLWHTVRDGRYAMNIQNVESRHTLEFRYGDMIFDPETVKNRVRSLIWFVDICKKLPRPSNLDWLSPQEIMKIMGLYGVSTDRICVRYSPSVQAMRKFLVEKFIEFAPVEVYAKDIEECKQMLEHINAENILTNVEE
jgi:hypothetical protein